MTAPAEARPVRRRRTTRRAVAVAPAAVAAVLAAVLAAGACGSPGAEPGVATARTGDPPPPTSTAADEIARYVEAQREWVRCLRGEGFADVPDPDARGQVDLSAHRGRRKTDPAWVAAQMACRDVRAEVPAVLQPEMEPLTAEQLGWRREYAACMRANGRTSWPDPKPDGSWPDELYTTELTGQEAAANERALQICDPVISGRPPTTYDPTKVGQG